MSVASGVTVRWFPPSWIEVAGPDAHLHIDPAYLKTYFARYPSRIDYTSWPDEIDGLPEPLEPAELVLVAHAHKDHCKRVTVARTATDDAWVLAPESCRGELGDRITVVSAGDQVEHEGVSIRVVPAYNTEAGRSTTKQHPPGRDVGYLVTVSGVTIYHAGDSDVIPKMHNLGQVDVACLPIDGRFTMDAEEAVAATAIINPRWVVPMHRLKASPEAFLAALRASKPTARTALLEIGETLAL